MRTLRSWLLFLVFALLIWVGMQWYKTPSQAANAPAPDFASLTVEGDSLRLSDVRGQWVVLHFWGSWCGPCRRHNRHLTTLYDTYHGAAFRQAEDFTIVSVALETDRERWTRAIQQDGLRWPHHVSGLKRMKDPVAQLYGVREIPATFLLDPRGQVLRVNPSDAELDALLAAQLAEGQ